MQPFVPQDLALALPFIAAALVHFFMSDALAPWKNAAIAAAFILATAVSTAWLSGSFVAGNAQASVMVVLAYTAFLMRGPLSAIMLYFADLPSPFDTKPSPANVNLVRVPSPLVIPGSAVPPRASATEPPSA